MILNHLPISTYSGVLKIDMKIFVNVARLEIGWLFTQGTRRGHLCTLDTFQLVCYDDRCCSKILHGTIPVSVHELKVKVTDFLCLSFMFNFLQCQFLLKPMMDSIHV